MDASVAKSEAKFANAIIDAGARVAEDVGAKVLMAFIDAVDDLPHLRKIVKEPTKLVLVSRDEKDALRARELDAAILSVPPFKLKRMDQIKMATLMAFSHGVLKGGEDFVFLSGVVGQGIDTLVTMRVGEEIELFQSADQPRLTEHIRRVVFERILTLVLELAHEGREGKPVGALLVIGDHHDVLKYCQEGRINPFKGYTEKDRNILDDSIHETVKELAKLDGAFVIKGNGVILSAGTMLRPTIAGEDNSQGLGARHAAAAGITACTKSIALSLSESTGAVRVWRRGRMITEIEKGTRLSLTAKPPKSGD